MERPFPAYEGTEPFIFVCYAHEDAALVYPEIARLHEAGFPVWYDEGISPGSEWSAALAEQIQRCAVFLYFVTPRSVEREHCRREISFALDENKLILPVHLEHSNVPPALKLSLSHRQAILRDENPVKTYHHKLDRALRAAISPASNLSKGTVESKPIEGASGSTNRAVAAFRIVASLVAILVIGTIVWRGFIASPPLPADSDSGSREPISLVVIPFRNLTGDEEFEYLADGLSEALMHELRQVPGLRVAPTTSAFYFKRVPTALTEVGSALNVDNALEGGLRVEAGERVRVNFSLIDIGSGMRLADGDIERPLGSLLDLQETLMLAILEALTLQLSPSVARDAAEAGTANDQAFQLYLKAQYLVRDDTADSLTQAAELLRAAIELDPQFFQARQQLVLTLIFGAYRWYNFEATAQEVRNLQREVEEIFGKDFARLEAGKAFLNRDRTTQEALARRHLQSNPSDSTAIREYAILLAQAGLFDTAYAYYKLAQQMDPFDPFFSEKAADMLFSLGKLDEALVEYEHCMRLASKKASCRTQTGLVLLAQGRREEAVTHIKAAGQEQYADCLVGNVHAPCVKNEALPTFSGYMAARSGDLDGAFEWFDRAADLPFSFLDSIRWQSLHQGVDLRGMARYDTLLARIGYTNQFREEVCANARELTPVTGIVVSCSAY